ncbi:MAG: retroviral-like aspartic protease family protein [Chloroflexi bacterium]|nr:retroviral-like aspartic protease family protein [Chloroflexota bacterium]
MRENSMGTFSVTIEIGGLEGQRFEELEALVDTGATTTVVPASIMRGLGITSTSRQTFEYASGAQVELDMAQAIIKVEGRETITWVIFGEEAGGALLGAYTLEGVFLGVDSYNRRLIPVRGVLK